MTALKCLLVILVASAVPCESSLKMIKEWREMEFAFPDEQSKAIAIRKGFYVPGNSVPLDSDVHYGEDGNTRIFVTVPRFSTGVPITLGYINSTQESNQLMPYPTYSWHDNQGTNCDGITSVFRVAIDECSRLWVLDTGKIGDLKVCEAQLLVFDLNNDMLVHRHRIDPDLLRQQSLLITPVIDVRHCQTETYAYMADVTSFAIIVYDHQQDVSWRVDNKLFFPYPSQGTFNIAGESFELMDGLFGMALSPLKTNEADRTLYFHALASNTENHVLSSVLRNSSLWKMNGPFTDPTAFKTYDYKRRFQATAMGVSREGVMFFGDTTSTSISCWNTETAYERSNIHIVAENRVTLQFPSGVKIVNHNVRGQELWVVTCRYQKVATGTLSPKEVNFRIQMAEVDELLMGGKCQKHNRILN